MEIAVIGAGNMGQALGELFAAGGHSVTFGARDPAAARDAAAKLRGGKAAGASISDALAAGELVVLALPYDAALELAGRRETRAAVNGKTVIDITNPLTPDYMGLTVGHTTSAGEEIALRLRGASVIKAFNTLFADVVRARAAGESVPITVLCAGDDERAKSQVMGLIGGMGFNVIDAGDMTAARYLEPLSALGIRLAYARKMGTRVGFRLVHVGEAIA